MVRAGKSLLAAGVTEVQGKFEKGDCIRVLSARAGLRSRAAWRALRRWRRVSRIKGLKRGHRRNTWFRRRPRPGARR